MRWGHRCWLIVLLGCLSTSPDARDALQGAPYFFNVADETVVPDGVVTALAQDRAGFIWIGTEQGLLRYDGNRFRRFRHVPGDGGTLPGDGVTAILGTSDGDVWVGTSVGIGVLHPGSDRFDLYVHSDADENSLSVDGVMALLEDGAGGVFIGTFQGDLNHWNPDTGRFRRIPLGSPERAHNGARTLLRDREGNLWIGTSDGLFRLPHDGTEAERVASDPSDPQSLASRYVYSLFQASDGSIWIGTRTHGLAILDPVSMTLQWLPVATDHPQGTSHAWINCCVELPSSGIWISTFGAGIDVFDVATRQVIRRLRHDPGRRGSLASDHLVAPLLDRSGLLWIGHWGGGLQVHNPHNPAVRMLDYTSSTTTGQPRVVSMLELQNGQLWFGTAGHGIDILDRDHGWLDAAHTERELRGIALASSVHAMAQTSDGAVWVASEHGGLLRRAASGAAFEPVTALGQARVVQLRPAEHGPLWIGTYAGLGRIDPATLQFVQIPRENGRPYGILSMAPDTAGNYFLGTRRDLFVHGADDAFARPIRLLDASTGAPLDASVTDLLFDRRGRFWIGSSLGIARMIERRGDDMTVRFVDASRNDAAHAPVAGLLDDDRGRLWSGRRMLDPDAGVDLELGLADGADLGSQSRGAAMRLRDGTLLFGGSRGVLVIDPTRFKRWEYAPPVVLSELTVDGKPRSLSQDQRLVLEPEASGFAMEFAALDFSDSRRLRYRYRLEGYDRDWIATDAENPLATYTNLWPGDYTLRVRGSNRNGDYSDSELAIPVSVLPAWWQTTGFAVLLLAALGVSIHGGVRWRTAHLRRLAAELEGMVAQRTADLRDSHQRLAASNAELQATRDHLLETQQHMVLQEKMASLGILTAGVAHEINNPANFADGAVQNLDVDLRRLDSLLRDLAGDDAAPEVLAIFDQRFQRLHEMVDTAREGHRRIKEIVLDLRQFTRLDEAQRKSVPIAEPIRSTINLVRTRFEHIRFELDLAFNPAIECQPAKLGQLFMNLVVNACDAIGACGDGRDGRVTLTSRENDRWVEIIIADNGCGMDAATHARMFEPFFTTKPIGTGTGLGLAIVFGILADHHGRIDCISEPGRGSRFVLLLPLATEHSAA